MLGKKKDKEKKEDLPEFKQDPTAEAKMETELSKALLDLAANEFQTQYAGIFDPKSVEEGKINTEAMTLDLLFAIFAELRIMRHLKTKK